MSFIQDFLTAPLSKEDRAKVEEYATKKLDLFSNYLEFGTGGMRECVDLGTNRLNIYNVAKLTFALAIVLKKNITYSNKVIIGYDSRITSESFAFLTKSILENEGFDVFLFSQPTPTPLISFGVIQLKAIAGIVITASHNPPQYNGYKVYSNDGGQIVSPLDKEIYSEFINFPYSKIPNSIHTWIEPTDISHLKKIEDNLIQTYIDMLKKESFVLNNTSKNIKILYSPLHGTGAWYFKHIFSQFGYVNFSVLASQEKPDGYFPTLKSPNPEDPNAFALLIEEAKKTNADILLATDPDADRVGCCVRNYNGEYIFLTGNQIGALLLKYILNTKKNNFKKPYLCKTIVTTQLQANIAKAYSIETKETLTGFKYIASTLNEDPDNYIFGGEESFGYLPIPWVRDKDSISSGIVIAEMAENYRNNKKNILDALDEIYIEHGLYTEILHNIDLVAENLPLKDKINDFMTNSQNWFDKKIGNRTVIDIIDLKNKNTKPKTDYGKYLHDQLPSSSVIQLWLSPEARITIRPSGTEPKIKIYVSLKHPDIQTKDTLEYNKKSLEKEAKDILSSFIEYI